MPIIYDMTTMILPVIDQIYWRVSVCLMKRNAVHFNYQAHQPKRWFGLNSVWLRRYNQIYNLCCWNSLASKLKQSHFSHAFTSQQCRWLALWQHQWVEQSWNPLPNFLFICLFGSDNLNLWSFSISQEWSLSSLRRPLGWRRSTVFATWPPETCWGRWWLRAPSSARGSSRPWTLANW